MQEFKLPSLGADMDEGTLIEWKVKPGDTVKRGDVVAIVDTSKAAIDVESWQEGTVQELLVQPGDKFPVGTVMATLGGGEQKAAMPAAEAQKQPAAKPQPVATAPVQAVSAPAATVAAQSGSVPTQAVALPAAAVAATSPVTDDAGRVRSSPAARKRAAELGIALAGLRGSGPRGSVTLRDVDAAVTVTAGTTRDRSADMRKTIAAAMSRSKREIPHYYLGETIALGSAVAWLKDWNAVRPVTDRVLLGALLLKAVARALRKYPRLNGFCIDGNFEAAPVVHIGVAIALRSGGLIAPALLDVATKPLGELMQALNDLVQRARAGSLRSSELSSPTITVTNLGEQSVENVFGVIYPPQVALVGFGGVREQVVAEQGAMKIEPVVHASLAADHRVSDGQLGARFLAHLGALLQNPEALASGEGT
jgi:pyruvate dehydrogenase E2 component (dihydrolipoamide acetyltransferase)